MREAPQKRWRYSVAARAHVIRLQMNTKIARPSEVTFRARSNRRRKSVATARKKAIPATMLSMIARELVARKRSEKA